MQLIPGMACRAALWFAALALAGCASGPGTDAPTREVMVKAERPVRTFTLCLAHGLDDHWPDLEHNVARLADGGFEARTGAFRQAPIMVNRLRGTARGIAVTPHVYAATPPPAEWFEAIDEAFEECDALRLG